MSKWEAFLKSSKEHPDKELSTKEYPVLLRLILFLLFLSFSGYVFYLFVFERTPQYYLMKGISNMVS
jgi:hypothetical protein